MQVPDLSYDAYISTGGPGSPLFSEGNEWEKLYFDWLSRLQEYNLLAQKAEQKPAFFICHSFQLLCRFLGVGTVCKRKSTAFGVFPVHALDDANGYDEPLLAGLGNPFYVVDSRDYQVVGVDTEHLQSIGGKMLCIEKERPHVHLERAAMCIRFNAWFFGTQFHPEADAAGMRKYLLRDDKKAGIIAQHGVEKWQQMLDYLQHDDKINLTYQQMLPNFLASVWRCK
jgi:GMP synthase-like glutamine amidotransferase